MLEFLLIIIYIFIKIIYNSINKLNKIDLYRKNEYLMEDIFYKY